MSRCKIHKYYKGKIGMDKVWMCGNGCGHYMPKHMEDLMLSKMSICWDCGEEFQLTRLLMISERPVCENCSPLPAIEEKVVLDDLRKRNV
jgi:hypothetical protein